MNTELLGLSNDSVYSHISWVRNVEEKMGVKITFPVIDDQQIMRAMIYYPLTTGRNIDEIIRLVTALQTTNQHGLATPAKRHEG